MNLDKTSKKVLKYIIDKSNGNLAEMITLTPQDSKNLNMPMSQLVTVCRSLEEKKLAKNFVPYIRNCACRLYLTWDGYLYFNNKNTEKISALKKKIIIPIIVALLTKALTVLIKYLLPLIQQLLSNIP